MPGRDIFLSIAAGIAAAVLTVSALAFALGGIVLSSLAQLPLFLVGLSLGTHASVIATASSVAVTSLLIRFEFGFFFGLVVAVPVVIMVRQALLTRRRADGGSDWYPPAGLLLTALGLTAVVAATSLPTAIWPSEGQLRRARAILTELPAEFLPGGVGAEGIEQLIRLSITFLPGFLGLGFFFLLIANAALAQFLLVRLGLNLRPTPRMADLALPGWFNTAAAIAAIGAFLPGLFGQAPGIAGVVGANMMLVCLAGFLFAGLAVIHAWVKDWPSRGALLAGLYVLMLFFAPVLVALLMLGLAEPWLKLRERFAGPAPTL
ncbi:MAG: DUF2232 domain-containing protein [Alphaproteobacteria bacterium]|nr:DUF2232 domain-containing protein [Alphaproteobacteria bacterium]